MKREYKTLVFALLLLVSAGPALAQTVFADGPKPPNTVYASLPSAAASTGKLFRVTDCSTAACTAGGGSTQALLMSNGSTWQLVSTGSEGGGGGPLLSQWFQAAVCINSTWASAGNWQMNADVPLGGGCNHLVDSGIPHVGTLYFPSDADRKLWLIATVPAGFTSGTVSLALKVYPGSGTGDSRYGVKTKCIGDGENPDGGYNSEQFVVRTQSTALRPTTVTFSSLTMAGCSAGEVFVIELRRDSACSSGCTNGDMNDVDYFIGGHLTVN